MENVYRRLLSTSLRANGTAVKLRIGSQCAKCRRTMSTTNSQAAKPSKTTPKKVQRKELEYRYATSICHFLIISNTQLMRVAEPQPVNHLPFFYHSSSSTQSLPLPCNPHGTWRHHALRLIGLQHLSLHPLDARPPDAGPKNGLLATRRVLALQRHSGNLRLLG